MLENFCDMLSSPKYTKAPIAWGFLHCFAPLSKRIEYLLSHEVSACIPAARAGKDNI
jgi:hypothetical protein